MWEVSLILAFEQLNESMDDILASVNSFERSSF